jgi:GNAT superfamily N-acetyltransferase
MIEVRYAIREDIPIIIEFQKKMALETESLVLDEETVKSGIQAVFNKSERGNYIVSTYQHSIVACMMITPEWSDWRNGYFLWIQSLYVLPEFRNRGIFKEMYQFMKNRVIENNTYLGLRLYVVQHNQVAQQVYSELGMNGDHYKMFEWEKG